MSADGAVPMEEDEEAELQRALAMSMQPMDSEPPPTSIAQAAVGAGVSGGDRLSPDVAREVENTIWGSLDTLPADILTRWLQGFEFSEHEPTALVQQQGGPCGVLAPVQGFLLQQLLFSTDTIPENWRQCTNADEFLVRAIALILQRAAENSSATVASVISVDLASWNVAGPVDAAAVRQLHECMRVHQVPTASLVPHVQAMLPLLKSSVGVLCLLYSVVLTRSPALIADDLGIDQEPLISCPFGHANQSLINLFLVGVATPHVFDGNRDLGGMAMRGIEARGCIGYLTLIEALKYCEVGDFLKSPLNPIWVVGSETHMTVLFSLDKRLVAEETPCSRARRVFNTHDGDGNGFIQNEGLAAYLHDLGPPFSTMNVAELTTRLDPDHLGIILWPTFLQAMFPEESESGTPKEFEVLHYNGMSKLDRPVEYALGTAKCEAPRDFGSAPIMQALRTKWSPLDVTWQGDNLPSIT